MLVEEIFNSICGTLLVLEVQVKLLKAHGPPMMVVILQLFMHQHELQGHVVNVNHCLLS
jgi:hypothetical protein